MLPSCSTLDLPLLLCFSSSGCYIWWIRNFYLIWRKFVGDHKFFSFDQLYQCMIVSLGSLRNPLKHLHNGVIFSTLNIDYYGYFWFHPKRPYFNGDNCPHLCIHDHFLSWIILYWYLLICILHEKYKKINTQTNTSK